MNGPTLSPARYARSAIALHWALALLLAFQLGLGWHLEDLPKGSIQFAAFQFHKSVGILILLLSLARLAIRLVKPRPAAVADRPAAMLLARAVHGLLYVAMIGGPLAGWALVSTAKVKMQTMLFGTIPWPSLPLGAAWKEPAEAAHTALAWLLAGLIALHVAGALRHHWQSGDYLKRMLPVSRPLLGAGLVLALMAAGFVAAQAWPWGSQPPAAPPPAALQLPSEAAETRAEPEPEPEATPSEAQPIASEEPSPAPLKAGKWTLLSGGHLAFQSAYSGTPVNGSFARWDADIVFSPEDLAHSHIRVSVDLASVGTADASRDDMLKSDSFFDVAAHPRAVFTANRITAQSGGRYLASGTLSLHGQTRPLTLSFTLKIEGETASVQGSTRLGRLAFGVGSGEWTATDPIPDAVSINFRLKARRAN